MTHTAPAFRSAGLLLCSLGLAACDNASATQVVQSVVQNEAETIAALEAQTVLTSTFAPPNADGTFNSALPPVFTGSFKDGSGNGYSYEVGRAETTFSALAGVLPTTSVSVLPPTGVASMSGAWQLAEIGKTGPDGRDFGEAITHSGRITLNAEFAFGTLSGSTEDLIVDGRFSSSLLTGNVYFQGRQATLTGLVGGDRAVGAFQGTNSDAAIAGGFLVER